jgi:hypothetical protein
LSEKQREENHENLFKNPGPDFNYSLLLRLRDGSSLMKKFTPGPWKVMPGISQPRICVDGQKDWPIVLVISGHSDSGIKANEKLIAAAPDLYDALELLMKSVKNVHHGEKWTEYKLAEKILKKARGK